MPLDDFASRLEHHNISYRAHNDMAAEDTKGALWTGGVSGQGVQVRAREESAMSGLVMRAVRVLFVRLMKRSSQFHGYFDWTKFDEDTMTELDYCESPAIIGVSARIGDHNSQRHKNHDGGR